MKNIALAVSISILAISAVSASAADLATKIPLTAAPASSWTGFYAGANIGGLFSTSDNVGITSFTNTPGLGIPASQAPGFIPTSVSLPRRSFIGGGQIGYNWQMANYVVGVEADIDGIANGKSSFFVLNTPPNIPPPGNFFPPVTTQLFQRLHLYWNG